MFLSYDIINMITRKVNSISNKNIVLYCVSKEFNELRINVFLVLFSSF